MVNNIDLDKYCFSPGLQHLKSRISMFLVTAFLAINHDISAKKSELPIDTKNIINHRISSTIPIVPGDKIILNDNTGFTTFSDEIIDNLPENISIESFSPKFLHDLYVLFIYYQKGQRFLYNNMYYGDDLLSNHLCAITDNMQFVEQLSVALFSYEWQDTNQGHTPVFLQKEQKMLCLGKILLAHVFLKERDIEHYSLALPGHSALVVVLDGQWYYMDPTYSDRLHLVSGLGLQKISWMRKLGLNQYFIKDPVTYNPDMGLFAEMLINQGFYAEETKDFDLALLYYYMAILANPDNPYPYFNAVSLQEQYRLQSPVFGFSSKEMYHMYESKKKFIWKKK